MYISYDEEKEIHLINAVVCVYLMSYDAKNDQKLLLRRHLTSKLYFQLDSGQKSLVTITTYTKLPRCLQEG